MQQSVKVSSVSESADSSDAQLVKLLFSISKTFRALLGLKLSELGLFNGQDELLLAIRGDEPLTVSVVADKLNVRPSTVSKMLDRLVEQGLVIRLPHGTDARRALVQITPAGREKSDGVLAVHESLEAFMANAIKGDPAMMAQALAETDRVLTQRLRQIRL